MPWLDTQLRCNRCGTRLLEEEGVECSNCHAVLVEFGVWSELLEWGERRRVGRSWFIGKHVLTWIIMLGLGALLTTFLRGHTQSWSIYAINLATSLILGTFTGWLCWRTAEAEFKAAGYRGDDGSNPLD